MGQVVLALECTFVSISSTAAQVRHLIYCSFVDCTGCKPTPNNFSGVIKCLYRHWVGVWPGQECQC